MTKTTELSRRRLMQASAALGAGEFSVLHAAELFLLEAVGGAVFGLAIGWLGFIAMRGIDEHNMEVLITLAMVMGGYALVGGPFPLAAGIAKAIQMKGGDEICICFLGDAANNQGTFHESLNMAKLWNLPVLYVCENNLYSVYSPMAVRQPANRDICANARALGLAAWAGDGNDAEDVCHVAADAVAHIRAGNGPAFVEFSTYRWREHCGPNYDNDIGYRNAAEFEGWRSRCPIGNAEARLEQAGTDVAALRAAAEREIDAEIAAAFDFARRSSFPIRDRALDPVYAQ